MFTARSSASSATGAAAVPRLSLLALLLAAAAPPAVLARTDIAGCVSSAVGASLVWYVPGTGELCEFLDCGGGRAPPKTTVPGCAAYSGTATYSPSYLPGFGDDATTTTTSSASSEATAASSTAVASASASATSSSSGNDDDEGANTTSTPTTTGPVETGSSTAARDWHGFDGWGYNYGTGNNAGFDDGRGFVWVSVCAIF
ncbi:hypothetical protein SLS62_002854 [Diatrype stigma]|uniref:Uncharacterized protein n=1 Tax=Diatrype stigma TaxID=117547 RepID=A0AAN9V5P4_9PEZI